MAAIIDFASRQPVARTSADPPPVGEHDAALNLVRFELHMLIIKAGVLAKNTGCCGAMAKLFLDAALEAKAHLER